MSTRILVPDRLVGHVQKGHPWLYREILPPGPPAAATGEVVALINREGKRIGKALFDADSPIALRVLTSRASEEFDADLIRRRVETAWDLRHQTLDLDRTTAFRLLHGEGDRLPGVVVDHYAGHLVMKLDTPAWLPHLSMLQDALMDVVHPESIYLKGITGQREEEGVAGTSTRAHTRALTATAPPEEVLVFEHGMKLSVDVYRGQKTGFFLDQRENRELVKRVSANREVLNLFSYTGGFSLAAACGGARRVTSVDIAKGAVLGARHNFELNGFDPEAHAFVAMDCFDYLTQCAQARQQFDMVIVDPPSFAPSEKTLKKALQAYIKLNEKAIRQVRPGGLLGAASCSSHVTLDMFLQSLRESAAEARRPLRLLEIRTEPADHPTPLHFPEGRYLKFVLAVVD